MNSANPVSRSESAQPVSSNRISMTSRTWLRVAAFLLLVGLFASSFYLTSSASSSNTADANQNSTKFSDSANPRGINSIGLGSWLSPLPQSGPTIETFAGDCTTPKTVFNLQDPDLIVCAKVTGFTAGQEILWSNANFQLVQRAPIGTGESTFTLTATSSLGDWRVILFEPFGGSVYAVTPFTVIDANNPSADVSVVKGATANTVESGTQAVFTVQVTNLGPSDAINVQLTDSVPANTTFSSFALVPPGPAGVNCVNPTAGASTGETICTIPTLARGETAVFLAAYEVTGGTLISNLVEITNETEDPNGLNNASIAEVRVTANTVETCTLDCPANKVVTADTTQDGQPGAVVTFAAATVNGNCGAVTNSPASGTFLPVGTHSIISQSEIGSASCTFTVTVLDTNPPTISCPANITVTAPENATEATVSVGTPTINASGGGTVTAVRSDDTPAVFDDNGNVVTPAVIHAVTDPYPIGSTGITWTVTDAGGRTASCTQIITVVAFGDRDPVTISCPAHVSVTAPEGSCQATISAGTIGTPTTNHTDNVTVTPRRSDDLPLSDPFPAGVTTITWTATDDLNGSVASCVQNVTVTPAGGADTTPPTLDVPPNVSVTTATCSAVLDDELGVATATDTGNCSGSNVNISRTGVPANFIFPTGTTTIIYTATDAAGNSTQGVQLVTVTESPAIPPTITAPADVTAFTGPGATSCGTVVSDATLGSAIANDNCAGVTVTRTGVPAGNVFPVGTTTVTYRATDASGNFTEDTQVVTVIDNTAPVISCPANITLEPTCPSGAIATWTPPVGTDNCPNPVTTQTAGGAPGSVFSIGTTTVTYSVTDAAGNGPVSCSFTVTVLTPQAVIQNLINAVNALPGLTGQQRQGLLSKLTAALDAINEGKTNVACNKLNDFIAQVQSFINNGTLTSAQGQPLINSAANVRNTLGCTSLPCT